MKVTNERKLKILISVFFYKTSYQCRAPCLNDVAELRRSPRQYVAAAVGEKHLVVALLPVAVESGLLMAMAVISAGSTAAATAGKASAAGGGGGGRTLEGVEDGLQRRVLVAEKVLEATRRTIVRTVWGSFEYKEKVGQELTGKGKKRTGKEENGKEEGPQMGRNADRKA